MKNIILFSLSICFELRLSAVESPPPPESPAVNCALSYFKALISGDTETADSLVTVPYSLDRKKILKTLEEVKAVHAGILEKKGKRAVPTFEISTPREIVPLDMDVFNDPYQVIRFTLPKEKSSDYVDIYVRKTAEGVKVIGFSD